MSGLIHCWRTSGLAFCSSLAIRRGKITPMSERGPITSLSYWLRSRGGREVVVTEHRTQEDWGRLLVWLAEAVFPSARKIHLVCDNLSTHMLGSLYLVLPPEEARWRAERFCLHPTPKHASWLNMAEIEISALERQCLDRRINDRGTLRREVAAWVQPPRRPGALIGVGPQSPCNRNPHSQQQCDVVLHVHPLSGFLPRFRT